MAILKLLFSFLMLMIYLTLIDFGIITNSKCCNNHPELGKCIPGEDDNPDKDGKCWNYCIIDCERGGVCKLMSDGHHECHCAC
ncbi:hypothetical protein V6Z11_D02G077100 [Gossypium hirsutum]